VKTHYNSAVRRKRINGADTRRPDAVYAVLDIVNELQKSLEVPRRLAELYQCDSG